MIEADDITSCLCTESAVSSWHEGRPGVNDNILNKQMDREKAGRAE